jgi:uncharacterized protein
MKRGQGLAVSPDLTLPREAVTQTFALLAVRRAGKSNAAAVMAELMYLLGLPFVAIDPKGDWWGLRSSKDGKGDGLPIPIFGGLHGDMPLTPESGGLMAALIVEHNMTCILDVSRFSKAARARFLSEFAEKLYDLHQESPQPRHLFIEEADRVVPQQIMRGDAYMARCVGAFSDIVRLGGSFGLGATLISQRSAVISKDVLTQVEIMIAMRTTSPQDRKAIRDWMEHHAIAAEIVESLPSLLSGEAWVSSSFFLPEHGLLPIQRIRFNRRTTFDSGATPAVGQPRKVATLADIDLGAVKAQMAEVTEEAEKNDPAALRREIARLKRELASARDTAADDRVQELAAETVRLRAEVQELRARPPQIVEVPAVSDEQVTEFRKAQDAMMASHAAMMAALDRASSSAVPRITPAEAAERWKQAPASPHPPLARARPLFGGGPKAQSQPPRGGDLPESALSGPQRKVLTVLAKFPDGRDRKPVGLLAGYSPNAGHFKNVLGDLRRLGFIEPGTLLRITGAGMEALGDDYEPLPEGYALVGYWMDQLGKAEKEILQVLLDSWPVPLSRAEIAERTPSGYEPGAGHFKNSIGRLKGLQLITGERELLADETIAGAALEGASR